jgi:hypothetical protein
MKQQHQQLQHNVRQHETQLKRRVFSWYSIAPATKDAPADHVTTATSASSEAQDDAKLDRKAETAQVQHFPGNKESPG